MSKWILVAGRAGGISLAKGLTRYFSASSILPSFFMDTEDQVEIVARATYTLADLYVRVISNDNSQSTTVRSRKNGANGAQSVSFGDSESGFKEDTANSDSLADGDTYNTQIVTGAGNHGESTEFSIISYTLDHAGDETIIACVSFAESVGDGLTVYVNPFGEFQEVATEADTKYRVRVAGTLSDLRVFLKTNTIDTASTFRTRVNGTNGNLSVSITGDQSGQFEDTTNTDSISSGDQINYQIVTPVSCMSSDAHEFTMAHMKNDSAGRNVVVGNSVAGSPISLSFAEFAPLESGNIQTTTEANTKVKARFAFDAKNYFVRILSNTLDAATSFLLRKNGADTTLDVSVGAAATGEFEDTTDTISIVATDEINHEFDGTPSSSGLLTYSYIGFELAQTGAPPPAGQPLMRRWGGSIWPIGASRIGRTWN